MYIEIKDNRTNVLACIKRIIDNTFIPIDENNTDYQIYLKWLSEGNTPEPAEEQT